MAEIFRIPNFPDINIKTTAVLDADATIGNPTVTLSNSADFFQNDKVILGRLGSEGGELLTIQSISGKVVTFSSNVANAHKKYEPLTKLLGDTIRLYRATNVDGTIPADSTFASISTTTIVSDDDFTQVSDSSGSSSYWYKATYANSISLEETALSMSYPQRGGGYGHLVSLEDIRREAGLSNNQQIDDTQIAARRDQAESEVKGTCSAANYTMPLQTQTGASFVPPLIENIVRLLAAGYILSQDYGLNSPDMSKDGLNKINMAKQMLMDISDGYTVLVDSNEQVLSQGLRVNGWPDDTTATVGTDGITPEDSVITMSKLF